jgi:hypothetical protein
MQTYPGDVVATLLAQIGLPSLLADFAVLEDARSNVSAQPLPTWAANALIQDGIAQEELAGVALVSALSNAVDLECGSGRAKCIFTREEQVRLAHHFAPLNTVLTELICNERMGSILSVPAVATDTIYREDLSEAFWVRAARRIYMMESELNEPLKI